MTRTIYCIKLQTQAEALDYPPYPGKLGQDIYQSISKPAWQQWVNHQTMLINEYRLSSLEPQAREFLKQEMEKFLFGTGEVKIPAGFKPTTKTNGS
jgi:Fe-S cluster biosynthesis and repair protein YggX